jgi:hypothetical protein
VVWFLVGAVVVLPLVVLAVACLRAYRAGKALAAEVGRASAAVEPVSALEVGPPAAARPPMSEDELRAREAALLAREAELERRLRVPS